VHPIGIPLTDIPRHTPFTMRVYGIDFASAPRRGKPITCACCELVGGLLRLVETRDLATFEEFEGFIRFPQLGGLDCGPRLSWVLLIGVEVGLREQCA
jgi:hypothetical protein